MDATSVLFESSLGWLGISWTSQLRVLASTFARRSESAARRAIESSTPNWQHRVTSLAAAPSSIRELARHLVAFADGEALGNFAHVELELDDRTDFQRRVLLACQQIPHGRTNSYSDLAATVGSPRAYRAVGTVMAGNRTPLIVPCHRVLGASGGLHGFSAPQGISMKSRLLAMEAEAKLSTV